MVKDVLKTVEDRAVGDDDQRLAALDDAIMAATRRRKKLNTSLRELRRLKKDILNHRMVMDCSV